MEQGGAASGAEPIAVVIKRVFQGVASIQDQITLPVAPTSKVEHVISRAAERNFPALYCLIRAATGERLDEKRLISDCHLQPGVRVALRASLSSPRSC